MRSALVFALVLLLSTACSPEGGSDAAGTTDLPSWVQEVYPEPGTVSAIPDAVVVHHVLTDPAHDVRLIVDDVDVTTYSSFDAETMRYESGVGPVVLGAGEHTAEVQLVILPVGGTESEVLDSYRWEFRTS